MKLYRDYHAWPDDLRGCSLAIGNFDGMHLGHQGLIRHAVGFAEAHNVPAAIMSFYPHPRRFFNPSLPPQKLQSFRQRAGFMLRMGGHAMLLQRFHAAIASMSAEAFIEDVLVKHMAVSHVVVGNDFRFGHDRRGDVALLKERGKYFGFEVAAMDDIRCEGERCASRSVRAALGEPDLDMVRKHLGRNMRLDGRVMHGDKRGRTIGFPTANIAMTSRCLPAFGVYAVRVQFDDGAVVNGVANIGVRPTVAGESPRLEVHLFDWHGDIYGHYLEVELVRFLRREKKFPDITALKDAITHDMQDAKACLLRDGGAA